MTYRMISFCGVSLEHCNEIDYVGSGTTPTAYHLLPEGGALDGFGDQQKSPGAVERVKSIRIVANIAGNLDDLFFQLLSLRGKRGLLVRETGDGSLHQIYARLIRVDGTNHYRRPTLQDLDLTFITQESAWRGIPGWWYLNAGFYFNDGQNLNSHPVFTLDTATKIFSLTLGSASDAGRAPVRAITITITAGDTALTALSITRTGGEVLTWAGSLAAGDSLVINTGTMQVTNDSAEAYSELTFAPTADMAAWFTLQPGPNEITVTRTGGGTTATITPEYYEAWY